MPRAETTPSRRKKRDAQPRASQGLARTAASRESMPTLIPAATSAKTAVSSPPRSWRHPDELPYIRNAGKTWDDMTIVRFLVVNAFSIPARSPNSMEPWVHVRCADGSEVILPRGYRLPLLWVAKYLWTSVKLVLTADDRQREWDSTKFEILHIARLCAGLLSQARAQIDEGGGIERGWRCALFDRALHRYWHEWLIMRDEFVRDFFREFGEEEYQNDILKYVWSRWVIKGHKGFTLATKEVADGITANEFMDGFVVGGDAGTFEWRESPSDMAEPTPEVQVDTVESKVYLHRMTRRLLIPVLSDDPTNSAGRSSS
ncbi:hypothetical protein B0H19DRAFT_1143614 [Mycena capillaripes]|nr:hypothetical protein B0H19DRAFT_1143614 [Mycena capillaripes]